MISSKSRPFNFFIVDSHWVVEEEKRLNASFYEEEAIAARALLDTLERKGVEVIPLLSLCRDVFHRPRFRRDYVTAKEGLPFLTPTDLFMFPLKPRKAVVNPPDGLTVQPDWILLTCSGTVGRMIISTDAISRCILSHDIIRIIPQNGALLAYIYAYLNSWVGQALLTKDQYGATVKHIEPYQVAGIRIPLIHELSDEIKQRICQSAKLREEAQALLYKAEEALYSEVRLPRVKESEVEYFGGESGRILKSFETNMSELNLRLDASYHSPITKKIEYNLSQSDFKNIKLQQAITKICIPTRFKRIYVKEPAWGVPFLQGSHVAQVKTFDVKFLSKGTKDIERKLLRKNWVLMTRSGTVGRVGIVRNAWKNWAASEHILRIILKPEYHPGFIVAFLNSDYGYYQIISKIYGAVVDEIGEQDTTLVEDITFVLPPEGLQNSIGDLVISAYDKRDIANKLESEAIKLLEDKLEQLQRG